MSSIKKLGLKIRVTGMIHNIQEKCRRRFNYGQEVGRRNIQFKRKQAIYSIMSLSVL